MAKAFFTQWLLTFGEFDDNDWKNTQGAILFSVSTCILTLILMNLVIAIMSDTYEKVMTGINESDNKQLNSMILQYENLLFLQRNEEESKHLFWVTYIKS